jgi:hypothetical protein
MSITSLIDKVERLNDELAVLGNEKRSTNLIMDRVLLHVVESMRLKECRTKTSEEEDSDYVSDIINEENSMLIYCSSKNSFPFSNFTLRPFNLIASE